MSWTFHFLRPEWLVLLAPAAFLYWLQRQASDGLAEWRAIIEPDLLQALVLQPERKRGLQPAILLLALWCIGITAAAGPTWRQAPSPFAAPARPLMLVLQVTPSMQGTDVQPTRLDRARQKIEDLLALRTGAPTGLIAYAGSAHLVLPPTSDAGILKAMAEGLSPDIMPRQGDAPAPAIALAARLLTEGGEGGSILLLADSLPPDQAAAIAAEKHPPLTLLGMLPEAQDDAQDDAQGDALREAARQIGTRFFALTPDTADVSAIERRAATIDAPPAVAGEGARWQEAGYWLVPLIVLLVAAMFRRGFALA